MGSDLGGCVAQWQGFELSVVLDVGHPAKNGVCVHKMVAHHWCVQRQGKSEASSAEEELNSDQGCTLDQGCFVQIQQQQRQGSSEF